MEFFDQLRKVMVFALSVGSVARLLQVGDFINVLNIPVQYQWLLGEGTFHILFLMVLCSLVAMWKPNENSDRYAYSRQIGEEDVGEADGCICAEEAPELGEAADKEAHGNRIAPQTF